jgi:hypothetical protein
MTRSLSRLILAGLLLLCGCGGRAASRVDVWGEVTFQGGPVPAGTVIFDPDLARGGDGPQGFAEIRDGRYDTRRSGKGAPPGPVIVRIDGFDGRAGAGYPYGKPRFLAYQVNAEVPQQGAAMNFEVPADARLPDELPPPP